MIQLRSEKLHELFYAVNDDSYKDIRSGTTGFPGVRERAKEQIQSKYVNISNKNIITFVSPSGTTIGKSWIQRIKLLDLDKLIKKHKGKKTPKDIVTLAIKGNIALACNDPSWLYWGWKYKASVEGYSIEKENRFPKRRNPALAGTVCKHLDNALLTLPFHVSSIVQDLKKLGKFPEEVKQVKKISKLGKNKQ